jgi:uncharacterized iron-regulated membrane protein
MSFRKVVFWCHLTAGVCVGIVVLIMSFTGVVLTYEKQMLAWADKRAADLTVASPGTPRASLDTLFNRVASAAPGTTITTIVRRDDPAAPLTVGLSGGLTLLVDPHTGHVIREAPTAMRRVFRVSTDWHRYLAGTGDNRAVGKAITGACNLAFLFIVLSGLYLWLPRRWSRTAVMAVAVPRWRHATAKARDFNWHNALGLWSAVPLAIVVASATVISYPWASDLAYRVAGEAPPARAAAPAAPTAAPRVDAAPVPSVSDLDAKWRSAEAHVPGWKSVSLRVPPVAGAALVFTIDQGYAGQPQKRGTLTLDRTTGEVMRWDTFAAQTPGRRLRSVLRFAHTGEVLGLPGQTVAGLVSAAACVLVVTGFTLACRRFIAWRRRSEPQDLRKAA